MFTGAGVRCCHVVLGCAQKKQRDKVPSKLPAFLTALLCEISVFVGSKCVEQLCPREHKAPANIGQAGMRSTCRTGNPASWSHRVLLRRFCTFVDIAHRPRDGITRTCEACRRCPVAATVFQ